MTMRHLRRMGRNFWIGGTAAAGLWLGWAGPGTLTAQMPVVGGLPTETAPTPEAAPVQRNYMNRNVIDLPIRMDESARSLVQEIHLYVKEQPSGTWILRDKGNSTHQVFRFQAPRDGEYWFNMVTVDKQGRSFPKDLQKEAPGLIVVIDTQKPEVELTNFGEAPEGQLVHCSIKDANIDNARVRFLFQGGDKIFRPLDPMPGRQGVYCIPRQAVSTGLVRFVVEDLAGNQTVCEEHVNQLQTRRIAASGTQPVSGGPSLTVETPGGKPDVKMPPPLPMSGSNPPVVVEGSTQLPEEVRKPNPLPLGIGETQELEPISPRPVQKLPRGGEEPANSASLRPNGSENPRFMDEVPAKENPTKLASATNTLPRGPQLIPVEEPVVAPSPAPAKSEPWTRRQLLNNRTIFLDYQIENVGTNTKSTVEVWLTRDQGKSWQKTAEDTVRKGPFEVQLPGEGVFGLTLLVATGQPATPPKGLEAASMWVEVDSTKPNAQITKVDVSHEKGTPTVNIQWTASDANFSDGPVELFYAPTPQGKWLPIAQGLKAQGQYRWTPPAEIGGQVHIRLVAKDAAGNTCICNTLEGVTLEDPSRPRITLRNVRTEAPVAPAATPATPMPVTLPFQIIQPPRGN